ncbi:MAG TPA: DUF378 domain-containing protein [Rubrivivax sp.]|nr:DUF378 domain-containing protein [Rubrivivax sp.]
MATVSSSNDHTSARPTSVIGIVALTLLIIGGLNWGLVGLFNFDLVAALFGPMSMPSRVVYALVGLAALFALTLYPRLTRH